MHRWTFVIVVALFSLVAGDAGAQTQKRVALVIGNSAYERAPALANPISDATAVATMLRDAGFAIVDMHNLGRRDMLRALRSFAEITRGADIAVVFFAGHGMEAQGTNVPLVPGQDDNAAAAARPCPVSMRRLTAGTGDERALSPEGSCHCGAFVGAALLRFGARRQTRRTGGRQFRLSERTESPHAKKGRAGHCRLVGEGGFFCCQRA
jgi:caspase domain-containing protein